MHLCGNMHFFLLVIYGRGADGSAVCWCREVLNDVWAFNTGKKEWTLLGDWADDSPGIRIPGPLHPNARCAWADMVLMGAWCPTGCR